MRGKGGSDYSEPAGIILEQSPRPIRYKIKRQIDLFNDCHRFIVSSIINWQTSYIRMINFGFYGNFDNTSTVSTIYIL